MAVNPGELRNRVIEKNNAQMNRLEEQIDEFLEQGYAGDNVTMAVSLFPNVSNYVLKEVMAKYELAGWKVEYQSDQRDGDYLCFSAGKISQKR